MWFTIYKGCLNSYYFPRLKSYLSCYGLLKQNGVLKVDRQKFTSKGPDHRHKVGVEDDTEEVPTKTQDGSEDTWIVTRDEQDLLMSIDIGMNKYLLRHTMIMTIKFI